MSGHINELAELYALGSLEVRERATVERHVRTCVECANRVRAAEETIAFISDLQEHHEPPQTIAENFVARLAVSRVAQKHASLKVITTIFVGGLILFSLMPKHSALTGARAYITPAVVGIQQNRRVAPVYRRAGGDAVRLMSHFNLAMQR